jgi:hypothetical protein
MPYEMSGASTSRQTSSCEPSLRARSTFLVSGWLARHCDAHSILVSHLKTVNGCVTRSKQLTNLHQIPTVLLRLGMVPPGKSLACKTERDVRIRL